MGVPAFKISAGKKKVSTVTETKTVAKKAAATPKKAAPKTAEAVSTGKTTQTDWGDIMLAFLTPWRNPNSIFLYMLIGVSVLGEINKN